MIILKLLNKGIPIIEDSVVALRAMYSNMREEAVAKAMHKHINGIKAAEDFHSNVTDFCIKAMADADDALDAQVKRLDEKRTKTMTKLHNLGDL